MAEQIKLTKVIVIDDIPLVIDGVELALSDQKDIKLIGSARTSREAVSLISSKLMDIDVAIVDLNLKEKEKAHPFELCKEILNRFPKIKVLAFTIYDGKKLMSELKKMGVKGYLSKNFEQEELTKAIQTIASGSYYFREFKEKNSGMGILEDEVDPDIAERILTLTPRELEITKLIVKGWNINKIAIELILSPKTINIHRNNIFRKMKVNSAHELTALLKGII